MDEGRGSFLGARAFPNTFLNSGLRIFASEILYCEGILQNDIINRIVCRLYIYIYISIMQ